MSRNNENGSILDIINPRSIAAMTLIGALATTGCVGAKNNTPNGEVSSSAPFGGQDPLEEIEKRGFERKDVISSATTLYPETNSYRIGMRLSQIGGPGSCNYYLEDGEDKDAEPDEAEYFFKSNRTKSIKIPKPTLSDVINNPAIRDDCVAFKNKLVGK